VTSHRNARAIAPATNTTAANPTVNASGASVSISDLYIVSPFVSDESRQAQRCEKDKASPRLKLACFGDLRGQTRGGSVSVTIAQALTRLCGVRTDLTAEFAACAQRNFCRGAKIISGIRPPKPSAHYTVSACTWQIGFLFQRCAMAPLTARRTASVTGIGIAAARLWHGPEGVLKPNRLAGARARGIRAMARAVPRDIAICPLKTNKPGA
jgi:hypothetical protein